MSNIFFRFWSWLERGGRWQNWSYRGHCDHSQVQPYIHTFFFIVILYWFLLLSTNNCKSRLWHFILTYQSFRSKRSLISGVSFTAGTIQNHKRSKTQTFLLWLWVRKYWTEHTFHRSCLWLISLDLDIWDTPRPQVNTGQLHQEWNPDDKGGQGGRTSACDFTINRPKGESYVRYLETNMWTFSKEQNDTIDGVPTI